MIQLAPVEATKFLRSFTLDKTMSEIQASRTGVIDLEKTDASAKSGGHSLDTYQRCDEAADTAGTSEVLSTLFLQLPF